jgi:16S rRNA C1402 N4-methylase RsmH
MQEIHKDSNTIHYSVLKDESVRSLNLKEGLTVVDATVNRGGHAVEIAKNIRAQTIQTFAVVHIFATANSNSLQFLHPLFQKRIF